MRKLLLACFMLAWTSVAFAQDIMVSGKVTAADDGSVMPGVSVQVRGTNKGTSTDGNGVYKISVPKNATLNFSFIGSLAQQIAVGNRSIIDVQLATNSSELGEVVVTGALGLKRQAKELGYAATTINNKDITQAKAVNVAQSLDGKISGLNITTTNSGVFENSKILVRGIRSLTGNNQPMLVIDGSPVPLNALTFIPPDDVDEINILKSASSAALYGPDAVNGVILVTTKRGKTNQEPMVTVSSSYQVSKVAFFPKLQHEFGQGAGEYTDAYGNYGHVPYENQLYGPRYDGTTKEIGSPLEDGTTQMGVYDNSHKNDKVKFWNSGATLQNSASIIGKDYYIGVMDAKITGLMPDDKNRRTTFRFNGEKAIKKFSVGYGLGVTLQNSDVVNEAGLQNVFAGSYVGSIMFSVMQTADNIPLLSYKDWRNSKYATPSNWYNAYTVNPYWTIDNLRSKQNTKLLTGNVTLGYDIFSWLRATARLSATIVNTGLTNTTAPLSVSDFARTVTAVNTGGNYYTNAPGSVFNSTSNANDYNLDYFLSGKRNVTSDLSVNYLVGGNWKESQVSNVSLGGNNLVVPDLSNVSVRSGDASVPGYTTGGNTGPGNYNILVRRLAAYGTVGFGYKGWAFLEVTGRNDWDSRLAAGNRSFFYPGANASVLLSDAIPALKSSVVSFLKVRGAIAKSGNVNIPPYALEATYSQPAGFPFGSNVGFTAGNTIPSPSLRPEFVTSKEIGLDLGLFNSKYDFEITYFNQKCDNQILYVALPAASGYTSGLANAASFKNYGVEMDLGLAPVHVGRGKFSIKLNATYNNSEVLSTPNDAPVITGGSTGFIQRSGSAPTVNNVAQIGGPAFQFQLSDYVRDPANGKVIVDAITGYPSQATNPIITGRNLPLWQFGATPKYSIGDFSASMTWGFKGGHYFYSGLGGDMDFSGISARSAAYGRQRFVFPNSEYLAADGKTYVANTNIQVQDGNYGFWTGSATNTGVATNYYASANAWRLKEVNISYNLPKTLVGENKFIKRLTISLIGRNLLLFVPKSNQWGDPEFNYTSGNSISSYLNTSSQNTFGVGSSFQTPASRIFGGSVTATF